KRWKPPLLKEKKKKKKFNCLKSLSLILQRTLRTKIRHLETKRLRQLSPKLNPRKNLRKILNGMAKELRDLGSPMKVVLRGHGKRIHSQSRNHRKSQSPRFLFL